MLPQKIKVSNRALFQEIENEIVILDLAKEQYFGLDDVGATMWRMLNEHGDTGVVIKALCDYYDTDESTISKDLGELLDKLMEAGLVTADVSENQAHL